MNRRYFVTALLCIAFMNVYAQNDKMNSFIDNLLSQMTLEEKIGQLNLPFSSSFIAG